MMLEDKSVISSLFTRQIKTRNEKKLRYDSDSTLKVLRIQEASLLIKRDIV